MNPKVTLGSYFYRKSNLGKFTGKFPGKFTRMIFSGRLANPNWSANELDNTLCRVVVVVMSFMSCHERPKLKSSI